MRNGSIFSIINHNRAHNQSMIVLFLCAKKSTQKKRWGHFRGCVPRPPQRVFDKVEKNKVGGRDRIKFLRKGSAFSRQCPSRP